MVNGGVIWAKFMGLGVHDGGLQRNDRDITWILLGGRDFGYFAVLSVNVYARSEMSFHTLQELNLDAARYRWVRDNPYTFADFVQDIGITHESYDKLCDAYVDSRLESEND